ncbi:uncharacterized protein G2W53_037825 [Senna tora]|uniref:Uncharacterized protein n=1 Tax=Senna tora TaxID=362788 RepID=A0A834SY82_9FABA|nr:uncharacterized protein G2W53_037825 [Senna tora]
MWGGIHRQRVREACLLLRSANVDSMTCAGATDWLTHGLRF